MGSFLESRTGRLRPTGRRTTPPASCSPVLARKSTASTCQACTARARNTFTGARIYALAAGVSYELTPDLIFGGAYTYENGNAQLKNVVIHQGALQLTYTFSKRTANYLVGVYQRTNGAYAAEISNILARGKVQSVAKVGVMHRF
ncbi:hypothetical protein D3C72_2008980 [compost metagenome]